MLITLPFVLLLLDYWPFRRFGPANSPPETAGGAVVSRAPFGHLVVEKLPLFALAAAIAVVTMAARERHGALVSFDTVSLLARLGNALAA